MRFAGIPVVLFPERLSLERRHAILVSLFHIRFFCETGAERFFFPFPEGRFRNDQKISDPAAVLTKEQVGSEGALLKKGKKGFCRVLVK